MPIHKHIFRNLKNASVLRREQLSFLHSIDDYDLIVLIASAAEEGEPLGLKQLELQGLMSSSTLQRHLKELCERNVISKVIAENDGRRVYYLPTAQTVETYRKLYDQLIENGI